MNVGRGAGGWILKISAKKVVFLVLSGKKQILPLLAPLAKFWKNPLVPPPLEKILPTPTVLMKPLLPFVYVYLILRVYFRVSKFFCCHQCNVCNISGHWIETRHTKHVVFLVCFYYYQTVAFLFYFKFQLFVAPTCPVKLGVRMDFRVSLDSQTFQYNRLCFSMSKCPSLFKISR